MAGLCPGIREVEHPAVGAGHCAENERLTNLLTRPAFSWKGRNRTADASLFRAGLVQPYLIHTKGLTQPHCPENTPFIGTIMGQHFGRSKFLSPTLEEI